MYSIIGTITPGGCFIMADDGEEQVGTNVQICVEHEDAAAWREQLAEIMEEDRQRGTAWTPRDQRPDLERYAFKAQDVCPADPGRTVQGKLTAAQCYVWRKFQKHGTLQKTADALGWTLPQVRTKIVSYMRNIQIEKGLNPAPRAQFKIGLQLVDNRQSRARLGVKRKAA